MANSLGSKGPAGLSRRLLLGGAAASVGLASAAAAAQAAPAPAGLKKPRSRTHVVLLGTAGGPAINPRSDREGIASALVVGDRYYLVDAGHGVTKQLSRAKLGGWDKPGSGPLDSLRAVFLTHLHSDHVTDLSDLFSPGLFSGLGAADLPIKLYGPGNRGQLPPVFGSGAAPEVVAPDNPTPGTVEMWESLVRAFAMDFNDRARDNRQPTPGQTVEAHDIELPPHLTADPNGNPHPEMDPVFVYEDDRVRVSAILVQHAPVFPAFAYRFDTEDGSAVFSGDTGPSDNLVKLAQGADVLVHEALSRQFLEEVYPEPRSAVQEAVLQHLLGAHTTIEDVGPLAERAGAKTLVLNHLVPAHGPDQQWKRARNGYSGTLVVGRDLDVINVG
ncbi:MBL fold metallo-hydrolase [Arthrobacter ginkgonis]|uniref:MBL fold metallo-hydrolase n=1 Tax=Arthrobacter ginkgonis TaxID=1630594 RepID=A0ABP7CGM6_9MICC